MMNEKYLSAKLAHVEQQLNDKLNDQDRVKRAVAIASEKLTALASLGRELDIIIRDTAAGHSEEIVIDQIIYISVFDQLTSRPLLAADHIVETMHITLPDQLQNLSPEALAATQEYINELRAEFTSELDLERQKSARMKQRYGEFINLFLNAVESDEERFTYEEIKACMLLKQEN